MKKVIVITGPTASGKTALAIKLAKALSTEIISGDSVQVYKGFDIASAKIKDEEKEGIIHHLIDISYDKKYTVYDFQKDARYLIDNMESIPIICGGTGYYIASVLKDYDFSGEERKNDYSNYSLEELLEKCDENHIEIIDRNNRRRIERSLDIFNQNIDKRINKDEYLYDSIIFSITMPRDILYDRINQRVDMMIEEGLIEEALKIYHSNRLDLSKTIIGYKELYKYFDGSITKEEAIEEIKKNTRNYAKRQYTWFKHQLNVYWLDGLKDTNELLNEMINVLKEKEFI